MARDLSRRVGQVADATSQLITLICGSAVVAWLFFEALDALISWAN